VKVSTRAKRAQTVLVKKLKAGTSTLTPSCRDSPGSLVLDVTAPETIVHTHKAISTRPRPPCTTTLTTLADAPTATTASTAKPHQKRFVCAQKLRLWQAWRTWTSSRSPRTGAMEIGTVVEAMEEGTSAAATVG
jgi:hypothetical protein